MNSPMTSGALEGIKVLEMAQLYAGPGSAMYLADMGADVIKVEPPEGDHIRTMYSTPSLGRQSKPFQVLNRNKRSVVVDIRTPAGREVIYRLAAHCDVMINNFRPGVAERLRLDYPTMERINPRLVYAHLSGFGDVGPMAHKPGIDLVIQAHAGVMASRRMPDGRPIAAPVAVADLSTAMLLAYGITLALLARERTGHGQRVDTCLLGAAIAMQAYQLVRVQGDSNLPGAAYALNNSYKCQDGEYILFSITTDKHWRALCAALDLDHLVDNPAFATFDQRVQNSTDLFAVLEAVLGTRPSGEWIKRLEERDIPCAVIQSRAKALDDPQVRQNGLVIDVTDPAGRRTSMMGIPLKLSRTPGSVRSCAPKLGQHTAEVLQEAGYTLTEIQALAQQGVIRLPQEG
ncbi:MAG: CoA transferase [Chloroflexi bacterium]|nr:CoA transferase [Chloroflexota bacterium]